MNYLPVFQMPIRKLHATLKEINRQIFRKPLVAPSRQEIDEMIVRLVVDFGAADNRYWAIRKAGERRKLTASEKKELAIWRSASKKVYSLFDLLKGETGN